MTATMRTRKIILLPKFNTWEQVLSERKKGSLLPVGNTVSRFFQKGKAQCGFLSSNLHNSSFFKNHQPNIQEKMRKFAI